MEISVSENRIILSKPFNCKKCFRTSVFSIKLNTAFSNSKFIKTGHDKLSPDQSILELSVLNRLISVMLDPMLT